MLFRSTRTALHIKHPNAGGIDIGGASHYVAVPADRVTPGEACVRELLLDKDRLSTGADIEPVV